MEIDLRPTADFSAGALAGLFCSCFADYFVPLHVDAAAIDSMVQRDHVDLARSCVAVRAGQPIGFLLLAIRGRGGRIAAMGVMPEARRSGLGRRLVDQAIHVSRSAGCDELLLEVITANDGAVRLYEAAGFRRTQTLLGFSLATAGEPDATAESPRPKTVRLAPTTAGVVADWVVRHGPPDLPWQLAAETIRTPLSGHAAFEWKDHAACLVTDPTRDRVTLLSLVVDRDRRRRGIGRAVLNEVIQAYPGRTWRVPEIVPEGEGTEFLKSRGWQVSAIQQFLMARRL